MDQVAVIPGVFRAHGDLNATQAALVTTAGTVDQVAALQAAVAVFGPIAADFLAAFAVAQANHERAVAQLAEVHAATDVASHAAAASYESTDADSASGFGGLTPVDSPPPPTASGGVPYTPQAEDAVAEPAAGALPDAVPSDNAEPDTRNELGNKAQAPEPPRPAGASASPLPPRAVPVAATAQRAVAQPVVRAAAAIVEPTRLETK